jgi:hypothetical protein
MGRSARLVYMQARDVQVSRLPEDVEQSCQLRIKFELNESDLARGRSTRRLYPCHQIYFWTCSPTNEIKLVEPCELYPISPRPHSCLVTPSARCFAVAGRVRWLFPRGTFSCVTTAERRRDGTCRKPSHHGSQPPRSVVVMFV